MRKTCNWKFLIGIFALLGAGCSPASQVGAPGQNALENTPFFAWMEGYIALAEGEEWSLMLTSFRPEGTKDPALEQASAVELVFEDDFCPIEVIDAEVVEPGAPAQQDGMVFDGLSLTLSAAQQGTAACEEVILHQPDGSEVHRKIGRLVFDVGPVEPETTALDTYPGPAVATSSDSLVYTWDKEDKNAVITAIQYGEDFVITSAEQIADSEPEANGLPASGRIALDAYDAPYLYIKAKITVQDGAGTHTEYARGCYCGTDFDADDIAASREHNAAS